MIVPDHGLSSGADSFQYRADIRTDITSVIIILQGI